MARRVTILNSAFDPLTQTQTVDAVFAAMAAGRRGWLCTVNVSMLMMMRSDPALQSFVDRSAFVVADGQPLVWSARLFGGRLPERVTGIDLIAAMCERARDEKRGIYLIGGTDEVIGETLARLRAEHPGLRIDGSDGYFDDADGASRVDAIRASGASLLLVGMGCPRQERFIDEHWERLGVAMAVGVGGSFDVLAGVRMRAHPWIGRLGFEWLVRLVQEPRRLTRRYLVTNRMFCGLIVRTLMDRLKRDKA